MTPAEHMRRHQRNFKLGVLAVFVGFIGLMWLAFWGVIQVVARVFC